ncbi:hypothetical protein N7468_004094 [Penicillium chermesinum]|uniref:Uncharacterized protein n=1 Tax=Penicillium chermesinum TaxID=63820 RepID=A0A9W9P851_9EURO|nr:uncharacterized protein N7468_004094 [Penicillium chermesinum]KAJ5239475.1 hypothetical protein N7468_004094 [Penicillium chermesinum]KAJ6141267.1 hypothetical protein N7470_010163 [Penicillium chermesinum]
MPKQISSRPNNLGHNALAKEVYDGQKPSSGSHRCTDFSATTKPSAIVSTLLMRNALPLSFRDASAAIELIVSEAFELGPTPFPAKPEDKEFASKFCDIAEKLLAEGKVKVHRPKVSPGGLKGVLEGLEQLKQAKVSGEKLVYNIAETP